MNDLCAFQNRNLRFYILDLFGGQSSSAFNTVKTTSSSVFGGGSFSSGGGGGTFSGGGGVGATGFGGFGQQPTPQKTGQLLMEKVFFLLTYLILKSRFYFYNIYHDL